ncbi:uncharacterized protein L201_000154 [Kwoniella dendrophila CBS 6074]|uniref:Uncharacterized protein n=1 Tax=Kwoniella dendrophila CBS 6074 TaxID=1295534 RepID=A0AAX4JIJ0_9TREE
MSQDSTSATRSNTKTTLSNGSSTPKISRLPSSSSSTAQSSSPTQPSITRELESDSRVSLKVSLKRPASSIHNSSSPPSSSSSLLNSDRLSKKTTSNFYRDSSIRGLVRTHMPSITKPKPKTYNTELEELLFKDKPVKIGRPEITAAVVPKPRPRVTVTKPSCPAKNKKSNTSASVSSLAKEKLVSRNPEPTHMVIDLTNEDGASKAPERNAQCTKSSRRSRAS